MYHYTPNPEGFKHYNFKKYKIDFFKNTAIISWGNKVDEDYDKDYSYKSQKRAILDRLRENEAFDTNFILINEEYDKKELFELYIQFKENLPSKDKKEKIKAFLDNMEKG